MISFSHRDDIDSVDIPDHVVEIPDGFFFGCHNLENVQLHDNVTSIGEYAFAYNSSLRSLIIPSRIQQIKRKTCFSCKSLRACVINAPKLTEIAQSAFEKCTSLEMLDLRNTALEVIHDDAFKQCESLKTILVPATLKYIGKRAFADNYQLENVIFPDASHLEKIDEFAFQSCKLKNIAIPDTCLSIGEEAFENCQHLESIKLPAHLTEISRALFGGCIRLSCVDIPSSVKKISSYAFTRTYSLARPNIPAGCFVDKELDGDYEYFTPAIEYMHQNREGS